MSGRLRRSFAEKDGWDQVSISFLNRSHLKLHQKYRDKFLKQQFFSVSSWVWQHILLSDIHKSCAFFLCWHKLCSWSFIKISWLTVKHDKIRYYSTIWLIRILISYTHYNEIFFGLNFHYRKIDSRSIHVVSLFVSLELRPLTFNWALVSPCVILCTFLSPTERHVFTNNFVNRRSITYRESRTTNIVSE